MLKTALFAAAAALATAATAAPVLAKDVVVHYGDLDLTTAKGQRTFNTRIHRAAKAACDFDQASRLPGVEALRCYREAQAKARVQMASIVEDHRLGG